MKMRLCYETFCSIALMFSVGGEETADSLLNTSSMKRVS